MCVLRGWRWMSLALEFGPEAVAHLTRTIEWFRNLKVVHHERDLLGAPQITSLIGMPDPSSSFPPPPPVFERKMIDPTK